MRRILVTLLGLSLAVVGAAGALQAQEPTATDRPLRFGIKPAHANADDPTSSGYFTHHLEPGDQTLDEALVINEGDVPVRLQVYVAEATTAINGGTAFGHRNETTSGVAGWVSLDVGEVSLQPGETRIVPFTITVPTDASPGDHVVGLLVEAVPTESETGTGATAEEPQFAVEVVHRVGVAVVIDVAGDRVAQLAITDLRLGQQHQQGAVFEVAVHNTGNVMVDGHGTLTVADRDGKELAQISFDLDTILTGDTTFFYIDHPVVLTDGDYLLHARVEYRALRGNDPAGIATLDNIPLEVVDGQPKTSDRPRPQEPAAQVEVVGPANTPEARSGRIDPLAVTYIALGVSVLAGLAVLIRRRTH